MLEQGYEALSRGDVDGWLKTVHVDVELHELAEMPDTAVYRGREELRKWALAALELVEQWQWVPEEVRFEGDDSAFVRVAFTARGRGSGAPMTQVVFHVIKFRDDQVMTIRGFLDQAQALEAVGLRE